VLVLNHQTKGYAIAADEMDKVTNKEQLINILMSTPRTSTILSNEHMEWKAAKSGFWGWQYDREEDVGGYSTKVYDISGIELVTKVRTEHTGVELPEYNESEVEDEGNVERDMESEMDENKMKMNMEEMLKFKQSLPPPSPTMMTADEYFDPDETENIHLGRPLKLQKRVKSFKSKVWCSEDFPLKLDQLLTVLRPLSATSVFVKRIVEFLEFDLPPGFPVKIGMRGFFFGFPVTQISPPPPPPPFVTLPHLEVPVLPMLSVQVTFHDYVDTAASVDDFLVPLDYIEADHVT